MPFPGSDPREFWQRAEERTQNTAKLYDQLGMAEYQAIEVFVRRSKSGSGGGATPSLPGTDNPRNYQKIQGLCA